MLEWNVYIYNINAKKIEIYNIFNHSGFVKELGEIFKETPKEERPERIKSCLRYFFWCKAEWEIIIKPWIGATEIEEKIDVYDQIYMNFYRFMCYIEAYQEEIVAKAQEIQKYWGE